MNSQLVYYLGGKVLMPLEVSQAGRQSGCSSVSMQQLSIEQLSSSEYNVYTNVTSNTSIIFSRPYSFSIKIKLERIFYYGPFVEVFSLECFDVLARKKWLIEIPIYPSWVSTTLIRMFVIGHSIGQQLDDFLVLQGTFPTRINVAHYGTILTCDSHFS